MKSTHFFKMALRVLPLCVCMVWGVPVWAVFDPVNDDTDIFLANPTVTAQRPNVLIIMDNTANWQQPFVNEKKALVTVVESLSEAFNVGWMMMTQNDNANVNSAAGRTDGGYIRFAVRQMNATNRPVLAAMVNGLIDAPASGAHPGDKADNNAIGLAMLEAQRYFGGVAPYGGYGKAKADYTGNANNSAASLGSNALSDNNSGTLYNSPLSASGGCAKNFIIYISNGVANENTPFLTTSETALASLTGTNPPSIFTISPNKQQGNWADEWASFMANSDVNSNIAGTQHVYTYAVEVDAQTTGLGPDMTALMKNMASKGKGRYFAVSSANEGQGIVNALNQIFQEIQAVNSVFASTTLPVSVNVRGTNLNQVYVGVFRPDEIKRPRWYGNLKCYKLGYDSATADLFLADADGNKAENSSTGFINPSSPSFWTLASEFWSFRSSEINGAGGNSDHPDGDLVEKGGVAEKLRIDLAATQVARNLYTCTGNCLVVKGSALSATPFNNTNVNAVDLGIGSQLVTSLTAAQQKTVTQLSDIRTVTSLSTAATDKTITNLNNSAVTKAVSSITTVISKNVTNITNGAVVQSVSSLNVNNSNVVRASLTNHGYVTGQKVIIKAPSCSSAYSGIYTITRFNANAFDYTISQHGLPNCTTNVTATTTTSSAIVTVPSHGFISGTTVTLAGVVAGYSTTAFNGSYAIGTVTTDTFTIVVAANLDVPTVFGTASTGQTTTATVTTSAVHNFSQGQSVAISGATPTDYNKIFTIVSVPSSTSFTVTLTSPLADASGTITATVGNTSVVATTDSAHGFSVGDQVTLSGADAGYNGTFAVTAIGSSTTFTYVPTTTTILAANTQVAMKASSGVSHNAVAVAANHGFSFGDAVTIAGASVADYNGNHTLTAADTNSFQFNIPGSTPLPASGTITAKLTTPTAIAYLPAHGFSTSTGVDDKITISGASPTAYNGTFSITKISDDYFKYPLSAAADAVASGTIKAAIPSLTAQANVVGHGLTLPASVTVSGATPDAFNGDFSVGTVVDNDNFTYTIGSKQSQATGTIYVATAGGGSATARDSLINWVRGADNFEDENANGNLADVRASIHGSVLHSKPAVVNYNRYTGDNDVFVFYGANDGIFRAVKAGMATTTDGIVPGSEVWGFIPKEFFGKLKRLRDNSPLISSTNKMPYFADGSIGVYTKDLHSDGVLSHTQDDLVYLYVSMRRGGRLLYALDVSNPQNPKYLWSINQDTTGFSELGYTWPEPVVVERTGADPILILAAGYDPAVEDVVPSTITGFDSTSVTAGGVTVLRGMGRGIIVVNALTGAPLWQAGPGRQDLGTHTYLTVSGMNYSMPSSVVVMANKGSSVKNRAYVGDTGGNIWRMDFGSANVADWKVSLLASVRGNLPSGLRKFLYPPDVVYGSSYDSVIVGSGDREHPFDTTVVNRMYMFKDTNTGAIPVVDGVPTSVPIVESDLYDATSDCIQTAASCVAGEVFAEAKTRLGAARGWYVTLGSGEKVVGNAITLNSVTFFNTNQPSSVAEAGTCASDLGIARAYQVNFSDASAYSDRNKDGSITVKDRAVIHAGGGFLPPPTPALVEFDGTPKVAVISGVRVDAAPGVAMNTRVRVFWYKEME